MTYTQDKLFVRIDDRLIHGQVVTTWVRSLGTRSIWVISDRAASEPLEIILLKSSVPSHLSLEVFTVDEARTKLAVPPSQNTLLLMERIEDVATLCGQHAYIRDVNLGGLRYRPGKMNLSKSVYVSSDETAVLTELHQSGVKVWVQVVPTETKFLAVDKIPER